LRLSPARVVGKSRLSTSKERDDVDPSISIQREISVTITEPRNGFSAAFSNPDQVDISVVVDISGEQATGFRDG
jgi:hypothetical protein